MLGFGAGALSVSGAAAAIAVGVLVLSGTGYPGFSGLGAFFVTSSFLSKRSSPHEPAWLDAPGHRRNAAQVAANGIIPALGGAIALAGNPGLGLAITGASLASAAADTWATSIGMASRREPVDIWRWKRVPRGSSGAISAHGTLGGVLGAMAVALALLMAGARPQHAGIAMSAGILGMFLDSLAGALAQGRFRCDTCDQPSERRVHRCGRPTRLTSGLSWLGNDGVNVLANALAGLIAAAWWIRG